MLSVLCNLIIFIQRYNLITVHRPSAIIVTPSVNAIFCIWFIHVISPSNPGTC